MKNKALKRIIQGSLVLAAAALLALSVLMVTSAIRSGRGA
jgi:hypothetical protein